ncbi:MAG: DUF5320 domain-containing protein [Spirochaetota bacterium]|nr:DUF5320 domain-containing protein [Spirochaetota bacterium]
MPGGDGTGPAGLGSMTGRAGGYCAGYNMPGYANPIGGRGFRGRGYFGGGGRGRGYRNMFYATGLPGWMRYGNPADYRGMPPYAGVTPPVSKEDEIGFLREQSEYFQNMLNDITKRLDELQGE